MKTEDQLKLEAFEAFKYFLCFYCSDCEQYKFRDENEISLLGIKAQIESILETMKSIDS